MMDYRLQVFRRVAELQNITRAARALHISQPAVTKHIQVLESELRVPLFTRSASGMVLTQAGMLYLEHARQVQQAHENVAQRLRAGAGTFTGRLRLGTNKTILGYFLPSVLAEFKRRYPTVTCDVIEGNADTIIGALLDQHVDLALIEGPCQRPEIQKQTIFEDEIIWIASPEDPIAKIARPTVREVLKRPLIVRELGGGSRQFMEEHLRRNNLRIDRLNIIQEMPAPAAIKRLVTAGLGISYVFRIGVEAELAAGKLVKINCQRLTIRRPFSVLFPQGPTPPGLGQAFIQMVMGHKGQGSRPI